MDSSRKRSNFSANSKRTSPAGVSSTDLAERSRSLALYACSSWRICALTADCERKTFWPAREKLFSLATKTKVVSWSKSMVRTPGGNYSESSRQMRSLYPSIQGRFKHEKPLAPSWRQPLVKLFDDAGTGQEWGSKWPLRCLENGWIARAAAAIRCGARASERREDWRSSERVPREFGATSSPLRYRVQRA